jgi:two-component system, LytTR family, sensor kinase
MRVVLAAGFWTAVALVFWLCQDWRVPLLSSLAQWWSWGLLTPLIIGIARRLNHRMLVHLALAPVFALIYPYFEACVAAVIQASTWSQILDPKLLTSALREMFWSMLVYGLIVGVWEAYHYQQRYLASELARLNSLRTQLDPHFLFNALNTISAQLEREPRQARQMIEHLGDLLRLSLSSQRRSVIPLAEELAFLEHYLAIQRIRFGDSLRITLLISPEVDRALVPSMLLQPLVENAIRHGLAPRAGGGTITVSAERIDDKLHIWILDDGVGLSAPPKPDGLGLSITRERIAGLHPHGSSHFSIHPRAEGGTAVKMHFPLRTP